MSVVGSFRKKPVVVEAARWDPAMPLPEQQEFVEFMAGCRGWRIADAPEKPGALVIPTLEGDHVADSGDWIIKGVAGEYYPCKPDIFDATYDRVRESLPA